MQKLKPRARCGNLEENNRYWESDEARKCVLCKEDKGTITHLMLECRKLSRTALKEREIFAEEVQEEAVEWCRELERKRREVQNVENKN